MKEQDFSKYIENFLMSEEWGDISSLRETVCQFIQGYGNGPIIDIDYLASKSKTIIGGNGNSEIFSRASKIVNLIADEHRRTLDDISSEYEAEISSLKKYINEMEKTSKLIGRQNLVISYFYQAGQMLSSSLDSDKIISNIVEMITNVFDGCFCCILTIDDNGNLKVSPHNPPSISEFAVYFNRKVRMRIGEGCEGRCVNERIPCQVFDVNSSPQYKKFRNLADIFNFQSILSVSLIIKGNVEGCISIYSYKRRFFPHEEIRILTMFSDQAARALENARLYQRTNSRLQMKLKELSLMHNIDQSIINDNTISGTASVLIKGLEQIIPGGGFAIDLARVEQGVALSNLIFEKLNIGKDMMKSSLNEVIQKNSSVEKQLKRDSKQVFLYGFPIHLQDEVLGVLWIAVDNREKMPLDLSRFIDWILTQFSLAIDKNRTLVQLIQAEKMNVLGSLLSGMAHEISYPLCRILGLSETAGEATGSFKYEESFEIIRQESLRCKRILDDLLAFARKYKADETLADINKVVNDTFNLWKSQKKTNDMRVIKRLEKNLAGVMININRMQQVFLNLIVNAYHALEENGQEDKALIIRTTLYDGKVRITFEDNGPGIPPNNLERIFQPFFTTKKKGKGTGLGLSLSRDIMRKHKGDIWVENRSEGGSIFILELPVTRDAMQKTKSTNVLPEIPAGNEWLLVVEDDIIILRLMTKYLRHLGYKVDNAANGKSYLKKVNSNQYDLIISDWIIPGIRGDKIIQIFESEKPELLKRIIICTGDILEKETLNRMESRGIHILYKPFEMVELGNMVKMALASAGATESNEN